jgi:hypothetical protein
MRAHDGFLREHAHDDVAGRFCGGLDTSAACEPEVCLGGSRVGTASLPSIEPPCFGTTPPKLCLCSSFTITQPLSLNLDYNHFTRPAGPTCTTPRGLLLHMKSREACTKGAGADEGGASLCLLKTSRRSNKGCHGAQDSWCMGVTVQPIQADNAG